MNCSSSADVNSGSASQEIPRLIWYWKFSFNVYEIPVLYQILCQFLSAYMHRSFLLSNVLSRVKHGIGRQYISCNKKISYNLIAERVQDSSVVIVTGYGLDGPGIESRWRRNYPHFSRPVLGPTQPPV
jgi:hypothetical protein